ncbi:nuclear transport factor 2 family protein [Longimicrobium sp.]|uniref:nuclear transport factor 2 family protein n=1 Tax=Longimicrobium sp. TaxID=2029185 RepID=UPI002CBD7CE3|nr:nuclear transport factor 2 family protein [Longimicrobium sp.]HSU16109.1 nuclear transport factor 2 family protein [Longimicrobium sp.]
MSRLHIRQLAALASVFVSACHPAARPATSPGSPAELRQAWQDAFNRADTAALVSLYAPDAVLVTPSGTVLTGGQVAARGTVGHLMEDRTLRLSPLHQRMAGPAGHLQGTWQARARGDARLLGSGTYFMVFGRERDGRWSILYHVWREDREPAVNRDDPSVRG